MNTVKQRSVSSNFIFSFLNQILSVLIPCITVPYLARTLGPAGVGSYSYNLSLVTYFAAFTNLGINLYGQRQIAYLKNSRKEVYSKAFWELILLRICLGIVSFILYFSIVVRFSNSYLLSCILALEIVNVLFDVQWLYQGFEEFRLIVLRNFCVRILSVLSIFLFIRSVADVSTYALIMSGSNLLGFASMWFALRYYVVKVPFHELHPFSHLKGALALYAPQVAIQIYTVLDKTMLGLIAKSDLENGYYEQAHKVVLILLMGVTALGPVMIPRIAALYADGDEENIKRYLGKSFSYVWMVGLPVTFGIFAVAGYFVPFFFGPGYEKVEGLLCLFSLIIVPIGISNIIGIQYLVPTGKESYLTKSVVLGAVVNFCLNMVFIRYWQATGATFASVIAEVVITSYQLWLVRRVLSVSMYMKSCRNYLLASVIMWSILKPIVMQEHSLVLTLMMKIGVGVIVYVLCLAMLRDKFFKELVEKVVGKIRKP